MGVFQSPYRVSNIRLGGQNWPEIGPGKIPPPQNVVLHFILSEALHFVVISGVSCSTHRLHLLILSCHAFIYCPFYMIHASVSCPCRKTDNSAHAICVVPVQLLKSR